MLSLIPPRTRHPLMAAPSSILGVLIAAAYLICCPRLVQAQIEANVPAEALENYELIYDLDIPVTGNFANRAIPYTVDRSAEFGQTFDRVAYYMELKKPDEDLQFMFVSGDAFALRPSKMGVPRGLTRLATTLSNMQVITNVDGIEEGSELTGHIEFFNTNYGKQNQNDVEGASDNTYDFGDAAGSNVNGHGCLQIHHPASRQTLLSYGRFNTNNGRSDIGIGNSPSGDPDWTNRQNANQYEVRRLQVYVRPGESSLTVPDTITVTEPKACTIVQRWPANEGRFYVHGRIETDASEVQARLVSMDGARQTEWTTIDSQLEERYFTSYLTGPAGWYRLELRAVDEGVIIETGAADNVGIGEIFIIAGDSTSANTAETLLETTSGQVCAKEYNRGYKNWAAGHDPLPVASGSEGSPWPLFGDLFVERFQVPVGLYAVGTNDAKLLFWQRNNTKNLYSRIKNALTDAGPYGVRGVLWQHGYNDAGSKTDQETYIRLFTNLFNELRNDVQWDVPWWVARSAYSNDISDETCRRTPTCENIDNVLQCTEQISCDSLDEILNAQQTLADTLPLVSTGPETDDLFGAEWRRDGKNFTEAGQREVAARWVAAIQLPQCAQLAGVTDEWFCRNGQPVIGCPPEGPREESCNNADDDCDGQIDEGTEETIQCGQGACRRDGVQRCVDGEFQDDCTPGDAADEICDALDNDCDGVLDEAIDSDTSMCGTGACISSGPTACIGGQLTSLCVPKAPSDEDCDGVDNDCDGSADEEVDDAMVSCGVGACETTGTATCTDGAWIEDCTPLEAQMETCDGLDNDCDGTVDNIAPKTVECGVGFCRAQGVEVCEDGAAQTICAPAEPIDELCDGLDNDCDGMSDEGLKDEETSCGVGQCRQVGAFTCMEGVLLNTCVPGEPADETCDGIDEDCDGIADEDLDCSGKDGTKKPNAGGENEDADNPSGDAAGNADTSNSAGGESERMSSSSGGDSGGCAVQSAHSEPISVLTGLLLMIGVLLRRRRTATL
ncbi:MAG: MopE-related protein [Myxococcota bacterium]|nr:MopE-related protein [Myxococcota bacterium]